MKWDICRKSTVSLAALLMLSPALWAQTGATDTSRGISIRYADGKISTTPLRRSGGMWTPYFPRISGTETARDGVPLKSLDVRHVVEGDEVVATVSLVYGSFAGDNRVTVATVRVAADRPVEVKELTSYGVEPITISLVSIPATYAFEPRGVSASPYVDIRAVPVGPNSSAYRVTVTNRAPFPLMWFKFEAHRNQKEPISSRPRGKRNFPLIMPYGEHTFEFPAGAVGQSPGDDPGAWQPVDRVEVTALMWQDGTVEGNKADAALQETLDRSRMAHLRALLKILRGSGQSSARLREEIAGTSAPDVEMEQVRGGLIKELERFASQQSSSEGLDYATWRSRTIADLEQWVGRIVFPKS